MALWMEGDTNMVLNFKDAQRLLEELGSERASSVGCASFGNPYSATPISEEYLRGSLRLGVTCGSCLKP
jgi:hypothetical protein